MKIVRKCCLVMLNLLTIVGRPWLYVSGLSIAYLFIQIINFFIILFLVIVLYEICFSIFFLTSEYIFSLIKFCIVYLFIYFVICFFNIRYIGYYQFKFFGISLNYPINYLHKYWVIFKEYNYFFLVLIHIFLLNLIIYSLYENLLYSLFIFIFYIFIIISIIVKIKWDKFDLNYKTKVWNLGLNVVLILVIGYYISLIMEYLVPSFILKLNGFDYFWKTFQNKWVFNLNFERSNLRWFNLYGLKKEYFVNMFFFNFKKNFNDQYILYNYNSSVKSNFPILKREYDKTILNYVNYNNTNILLLQESLVKNTIDLLDINRNNNNIIIKDEYNYSFYKDYDIKKIIGYETTPYDIFNVFNFKNFLYNKYNFIIQNHLENKDIYPLEENNYVLKNLLKKDVLNYNYLLLEDNNTNIKIYEDYLQFTKKKIGLYNNLYDLLLLKKNWKALNFIKLNSDFTIQVHYVDFYKNITMQYLSLKDFNTLFNYNINNIRLLIPKLDLFILNWENKQISIKHLLIKESYTPNNFNVKKVLKNLLIGLKNNPNDLLIKNFNMEKNKISSYFYNDDFLDFIELLFDKSKNIKKFKIDLLNDFNFEEYKIISRNIINQYKNSYIDLNLFKKQLEEFAYQKYSKYINFSLKDLNNILNLYYILLEDEILEVDIQGNKVNSISYKEYQNRLVNINIYNDMLSSKEIVFKQSFFNKLQFNYIKFVNNVNKYFPIINTKNSLLNKMIAYYENKLILSTEKDKFLLLNNMEKIIYFFNHKATSMTNDDHKHVLSIYNIQKLSMSYMRYNNIKANYKFLYDYDLLNDILFRHLNLQLWNDKNWLNIDIDDLIKYYKIRGKYEKESLEDYLSKIDEIYNNLIVDNKEGDVYIIGEGDEAKLVVKQRGKIQEEHWNNEEVEEVEEEEDEEEKALRQIKFYLHQQQLLEYLNPNLEFFYNLYMDSNCRFDIFAMKIKYVFFQEIRSRILKPLIMKQSYVQRCIENIVNNKKEINVIEGKLSHSTSVFNVNFASFEYKNNEVYDDVIIEIKKYLLFMQEYEYYEKTLKNELLGIKDDIMRTAEYKSFVEKYKYILNDKEKLFYIKELCNNKESWIQYFNDIREYNNATYRVMHISQEYQLQTAGLNMMLEFYKNRTNGRFLMEVIINNIIEKYNVEVEQMLEDLKVQFMNMELRQQIEIIELQEQEDDLFYEKVNYKAEIVDLYKEKLKENIQILHKTFFLDILERYPNIKYKSASALDKALKNKNWELYKMNRLNEEHWSKNFKDYNKIVNKKPYVFRK